MDPRDYQAKPADVLVQNGLELAVFLEDMVENAGNADLVIIDSSADIDVIAFAEAEHSDGHSESCDRSLGELRSVFKFHLGPGAVRALWV